MIINQNQAAKLLGVDVKSIQNWQKLPNPIPYIKKNVKANEYEDTEIVQWYVSYKIQLYKNTLEVNPDDKKKAEARKAISDANIREMEEAEKKGELLPVKEVERQWTNLVYTIRQSILNLPHILSSTIDDGDSYVEKKEKIQREVDNILKNIAEDELIEP